MRKVNNALSAGLKQPREMGMREMDQVGCAQRPRITQADKAQYISKINKQNFDLKLEVFHRTQQMSALVKRLERMEELEEELKRMRELEDQVQELRNAEEDNQRLREANDELHNELDKRDQAVTEAVELICKLEAKVEELGSGRRLSTPSTARPLTSDGSDIATPKIGATIDIPERTSSKRATMGSPPSRVPSGPRNLERAPSFLQEEKKNTAALRALFAPIEAPSNSAMSVLTKTESSHSMNGAAEAQSPRISALSECSELNPYDSPSRPNGLDQLDIPIRAASPPESSRSSGLAKAEEERNNDRINRWMQPQEDISPLKLPKRERAKAIDVFSKADTPSVESDLGLNDQPSKLPSASLFSGLRLPPTPDTMLTSRATATTRSNGSISVGKGPSEEALMKRRMARPHSADELKTKLNSYPLSDSMDVNASGASAIGPKADGKDETPAIFPLYGLPSQSSHIFNSGVSNIPTFGYYGGATSLDGNKKEATNMNTCDSSSSKSASTQLSDSSSSPTLAPYDWVEAAKMEPHSQSRNGKAPMEFGIAGAQGPSRSSFWGRRHSVGSSIRDAEAPVVPTLDLNSLEPRPQAPPGRESRRRISLRPPFFSRSILNPRRLQQSPLCDVPGQIDDDEDGAPSPVIRKTRQPDHERPRSTYGDLHADTNGDYIHKTLPHSFTESNMSSIAAAQRPSTANGKDHKRRGSLSIFGWMKGASGALKKSEPNSPTTTIRPGSRMMTHTRLPETPEPTYDHTPTAVTPNSPDMNSTIMDDQDPRRRPRYVERERRGRRT